MSSPVAAGPAVETLECPICMQEMSNPENLSTTSCGHTFHRHCTYSALNEKVRKVGKALCPYCRSDQKVEQAREQIEILCGQISDKDIISATHTLTAPELNKHINTISISYHVTALYMAINEEVIELIDPLINLGALLTVQNDVLSTPLAQACFSDEETFAKVLGIATVEELDESQGEYGCTLNTVLEFSMDVKLEILEVIRRIVEKGADVNLSSNKGLTPLHFAIKANLPNVVAYLLLMGANPNNLANGHSPLRRATELDLYAMIPMLFTKDADVALCSNGELSALQYASLCDKEALDNLLVHATVEQLNRQNKTCDSALNTLLQLYTVAATDPLQTIDQLIARGADINLLSLKTGFAPIHEAINSKLPVALNALVSAKADINMLNGQGESALEMAALANEVEMVTFLLSKKPNLDPTLIEKVNVKGFNEVAELLTAYQRDQDIKSESSSVKRRRAGAPSQ